MLRSDTHIHGDLLFAEVKDRIDTRSILVRFWFIHLYRIAISVKMSALLYLPALLMNLNFHFGIMQTLAAVLFLIIAQLVIGYEFIAHN